MEQDLLTGRRGGGKGVAEADSVEGRKGVDVRRVGYIRHFVGSVGVGRLIVPVLWVFVGSIFLVCVEIFPIHLNNNL